MNSPLLLQFALGALLAVYAQWSQALVPGDFEFVSGNSQANYDVWGKPNTIYNINNQLPQDVLTNVYSLLPEGQSVNDDYIVSDRRTNIVIDDDLGESGYAEVSITFLNEGAGFRNSLGYYIYDADNPPQTQDDINSHIIIFPNASKWYGGTMLQGDTLDLNIQLTEGQAIGFFVVPNGWSYSGSYNNVSGLGQWGTPFYSNTELNPESTALNRRHNVVFVDTVNEFLVIGFEDLYRPQGDNDFNDLLFTVDVTPFHAIEGINEDGSTDSIYEPLTQTNNPDVVMTSVYPSSSGWATLMFEDRWPLMGDYDFNDLVMRYRITEELNGSRDVIGFTALYQLQAMGAAYHNGFAVELPGLVHDDIDTVTLTLNGEVLTHQVLEDEASEVVLVVHEDLWQLLNQENAIDNDCVYFRTQSQCLDTQDQTYEFQLEVVFTEAVSRDVLGRAPYNPFIFASEGYHHGSFTASNPGRGWETHLKNKGYTQQFTQSFFNLGDDHSGNSVRWVNVNNFPWVLNISSEVENPLEEVDLSLAYPEFASWVLSDGENNSSWYSTDNAATGKTAISNASNE